jgi:hypothetical protein
VKFKQHLAQYFSGNLAVEELPGVALIGLEEGQDSPSLRILAGLNEKENPFNIESYFNDALSELKITPPTKRQAAIEYAYGVIDEILSGQKEIITGTQEVSSQALASYEFSSESEKYVFENIGFAKAYGLLDTFDELKHADHPWHETKSNAELMAEVKQLLLEELKIWRSKGA